jgi:hypothetical protein
MMYIQFRLGWRMLSHKGNIFEAILHIYFLLYLQYIDSYFPR